MADPVWKPNPGHCPPEAQGRRVRVILRKDAATMTEPKYDDWWNPMSPPGWAADGKGGCRWSLSARRQPREFEIAFYSAIGA